VSDGKVRQIHFQVPSTLTPWFYLAGRLWRVGLGRPRRPPARGAVGAATTSLDLLWSRFNGALACQATEGCFFLTYKKPKNINQSKPVQTAAISRGVVHWCIALRASSVDRLITRKTGSEPISSKQKGVNHISHSWRHVRCKPQLGHPYSCDPALCGAVRAHGAHDHAALDVV
jgi:hypothetical protein